jgi:diadenosine tetraphosphatase ApaH/serine/threonine PP2A family protein phosphatase
MKIAILADIHGNLEALQAVLSHCEGKGVEEWVCPGDMIGYGPDPDGVLDLLRKRNMKCVLGNHEAPMIDPKYRKWLNFQALENNDATQALLSKQNQQFIRSLPYSLVLEDCYFVHGFPLNSVVTYLHKVSSHRIVQLLKNGEQNIYFVGHTHKLFSVRLEDGEVDVTQFRCEKVQLVPDEKYIISCGSVGQPRDGSPGAKYVIYDTSRRLLEIHSVPYDTEKTIAHIQKRGFPKVYGLRLR